MITVDSKSSDHSSASRHESFINSRYPAAWHNISLPFSLLLFHTHFIMTANLPDFMTDPNAVLNDTEFEWRYGRVPSYTKVNEAYEQGTRVMFILS